MMPYLHDAPVESTPTLFFVWGGGPLLLLCVGDQDLRDALPALDLLSHDLRAANFGAAADVGISTPDAILVDATQDLRQARHTCLELQATTDAPILVVIAEASLPALSPNWGLTDFVLPGASPAEVEGRLHLAVRLAESAHAARTSHIRVSGLDIDESSFTAKMEGETLDLTFKEFELLRFLVTNQGRVFTREQLLSEVWGTNYYGGTRTIDVHVRRLRAKLGDSETLIGTVRGVGYGFAADADRGESREESQ